MAQCKDFNHFKQKAVFATNFIEVKKIIHLSTAPEIEGQVSDGWNLFRPSTLETPNPSATPTRCGGMC